MRLSKKTFLIVGLILVAATGAGYVAQSYLISRSFAQVERQQTERSLEGALQVIANDVRYLDSMVWDWAAWDDTYEFVVDGNEDYVRSNLVDGTFIGAGLNVVVIADTGARVVFGKGFDLETEKEMVVAELSQDGLYPGHPLLDHVDTDSSIAGVFPTARGPLLVASRPIVTSEDEGPIRGSLLMGYLIDDRILERWSEMAQHRISVRPVGESRGDDFELAESSLSAENPVFVRKVDEMYGRVHGDPRHRG